MQEGSSDQQQALTPQQIEQRQQLQRDADALSAQLQTHINQLGPYDPGLAELQLDLGQTLLSLERYEEAADMYMQALQISRINDGLYDDRQIAILQGLIDAHAALQQWTRVDDFVHLRFNLQSRRHSPGSTEYVDALLEHADWQLQASRYSLLDRPGSDALIRRLYDMQDTYRQLLAAAQERGNVSQQWSILQVLAATDTEIARHVSYQSAMSFDSAVPRYVMQTVCRMVSDGNGGSQRVCWRERVSNPDYYHSAVNQRRNQLERVRISLRDTQRDMQQLLAANPGFAVENAEQTNDQLQFIERTQQELQRELRRSSLRDW
ncbi:tetratricopeptide repeat protein [Pseudohongiella spirulinae]|uniref:tetratricopeptide repeat protein n=1 Tax=Pseudohongiella spirulinae TaxID=1249552 RepID=UPI00146FD9B3|nr:tetratricopeptide repeat protein [Pseudohongiella spirulinae]